MRPPYCHLPYQIRVKPRPRASNRDVMEWLRKNAPAPRTGQNYHQWLNGQFGLRKLIEHIWMLIGMASACHDMAELRQRMAEKFNFYDHCLFHTTVEETEWDEATGRWIVYTDRGDAMRARFVILAKGILTTPKLESARPVASPAAMGIT